jgi:hypothetical protein
VVFLGGEVGVAVPVGRRLEAERQLLQRLVAEAEQQAGAVAGGVGVIAVLGVHIAGADHEMRALAVRAVPVQARVEGHDLHVLAQAFGDDAVGARERHVGLEGQVVGDEVAGTRAEAAPVRDIQRRVEERHAAEEPELRRALVDGLRRRAQRHQAGAERHTENHTPLLHHIIPLEFRFAGGKPS